jgi:magnesium transporter
MPSIRMPQNWYCLAFSKARVDWLSTLVHILVDKYIDILRILRKAVIAMIFLSTLLRQSVYDLEGRRLGVLRDVYVTLNETFPVVTALVVRSTLSNNDIIIPWSQVDNLEEPQIHLTVKRSQLVSYVPGADTLLLGRDILDKQIVDTQGFRVVKVNDLKLAQIKKTVRLVGVDISLSGLLRRLGLLAPVELVGRVLPVHLPERTITWNYVEPIQVVRAGTGQLTPALAGVGAGAAGVVSQVQLSVSHTKLADLHPADIADILEQLDVEDAGAVLDRLSTETAADTLNEVETPLQSELLSELDPRRASDLLEQLAPDDAADILSDMPREEAERLLSLMPAGNAQSIRELLRYGAKTAGGIMTTEVFSLSEHLTCEETLVYLRRSSEHLEMIYNLYVVDDEHRLVGVVSLRELVVADPATHLEDLMDRDVIKVSTDTDQEEVARIIAKYDLLGVPVVDNENHLVGLITVDDVIDVLHEEEAEDFSEIAGASVEELEEEEHFSWRAVANRITWLAVNVVAGFALALLLYQLFGPGSEHNRWLTLTRGSQRGNLFHTDAAAGGRQHRHTGAWRSGLATSLRQGQRFLGRHLPRTAVRDHWRRAGNDSCRSINLAALSFMDIGGSYWPWLWFYTAGSGHLRPAPTDSVPATTPARQPGERAVARPNHRFCEPEHFPCGCTLADWPLACVNPCIMKKLLTRLHQLVYTPVVRKSIRSPIAQR